MSASRIDAPSVSGVWSHGLSGISPAGEPSRAQAFGDFSGFSRHDGRIGLSGAARDLDDTARAVADRLTDTRDNGFL